MTKEKIIELLSNLENYKIPQFILDYLNIILQDYMTYDLKIEGNVIKINTPFVEGKSGSYHLITCEFDKETGNISVVNTKKEYMPQMEVRYSFREEVGINMFTSSRSRVFSSDGTLIYQSSFDDEHKYFGKNNPNLEYTKDALFNYFDETSPVYEKGFVKESAYSSYQPFTYEWKRYGKTHVVEEHGRNPLKGEFGSIIVTFDDNSIQDLKIAEKINQQIYYPGQELKINSEQEIVEKLEQIYQESYTNGVIDLEKFKREVNSSLFKSRVIY